MTLIEWLREQLDADERVALAASPGPWTIDLEDAAYRDPDDVPIRDASGEAICQSPDDLVRGGHSQATAEHIAAWDPARVLAEVKAKRAVLELHAPWEDGRKRLVCGHCHELCHSRSGLACDNPDSPYPCPTVSLLAQPYADRPGWQPEWSVGE